MHVVWLVVGSQMATGTHVDRTYDIPDEFCVARIREYTAWALESLGYSVIYIENGEYESNSSSTVHGNLLNDIVITAAVALCASLYTM